MDRYLLLSASLKGQEYFRQVIAEAVSAEVELVSTPSAARRKLIDTEYDVIIINAGLADDEAIELARDLSLRLHSGILLVVKSEIYDQTLQLLEGYGVFVLAKPISRQLFVQLLRFAATFKRRIDHLMQSQKGFEEKLEEIRCIDRAKILLIEHLGMTEETAHRYIEKEAMDLRRSKRAVAEDICKTYEM